MAAVQSGRLITRIRWKLCQCNLLLDEFPTKELELLAATVPRFAHVATSDQALDAIEEFIKESRGWAGECQVDAEEEMLANCPEYQGPNGRELAVQQAVEDTDERVRKLRKLILIEPPDDIDKYFRLGEVIEEGLCPHGVEEHIDPDDEEVPEEPEERWKMRLHRRPYGWRCVAPGELAPKPQWFDQILRLWNDLKLKAFFRPSRPPESLCFSNARRIAGQQNVMERVDFVERLFDSVTNAIRDESTNVGHLGLMLGGEVLVRESVPGVKVVLAVGKEQVLMESLISAGEHGVKPTDVVVTWRNSGCSTTMEDAEKAVAKVASRINGKLGGLNVHIKLIDRISHLRALVDGPTTRKQRRGKSRE